MLRRSVKNLRLGANCHHFGHLIQWNAVFILGAPNKVDRLAPGSFTLRMATTVKMTYIRNEAGEFVCPECGVIKARQNTMFYHMKKHAGALTHQCAEPGCGKGFIQKSGLQQHMAQAHPAEGCTLYTCPCCPHTCKMKNNLIIHIGRKHGAGWIPELCADGTCGGCKKEFSSDTSYYYHAVQCFQAPAEIATKLPN